MNDEVDFRLDATLTRIADLLLIIIGSLAIPALLVRLALVDSELLSLPNLLSIGFISIGLPVAFLRKRVGSKFKSAFISSAFYLMGVAITIEAGAVSSSAVLFLVSVFLSTVFFGPSIGGIVYAISLVSLPAIGLLTEWRSGFGILEPVSTLQSQALWASNVPTFAVIGLLLLFTMKALRADLNAAFTKLVTEQNRLVELRAEEQRFHTIADFTYDWEMWVGPGDDLLYVSPSCERITGYRPEQFMEDPGLLMAITHPDDQQAYSNLGGRCDRLDKPEGLEFRILTKTGTQRWIEHRRQPVVDVDDEYLGYRVSNRESTARKSIEQMTEYSATHDVLTDLPNRSLLLDRLGQALADAQRRATRVALIFIDLDGFKPINDRLGHAVGDRVLQEFASRLKGSTRESDTAARIGGDEFVVVLPNLTLDDPISSIVEKLQESLAGPYPGVGDTVTVGLTMGVALYPDNGDSSDELLKAADTAMYDAKRNQKGGIRYASRMAL